MQSNSTKPIRIGTRSSPLALWQANHVANLLRQANPGQTVELVEIQTVGDQVRDRPLSQIGGEGVFTKAIQDALLGHQADVAVHSLKDLPTVDFDGLILAAVPERAPVGDAFVSTRHETLDGLPEGAVVATSSMRRRAQILHHRPDLQLIDIRGNVETRLKKLNESALDGIILAQAGLQRLGLAQHITEILDPRWMLPAVGQGALGLECRADDTAIIGMLEGLSHRVTHAAVLAERACLRGLGGGCQIPIGTMTQVQSDRLLLRAAVLSPDGKQRVEDFIEGSLAYSLESLEKLGYQLADKLRARGAAAILES